nr:unnamed protein product [Digitaria exilis]
MCAREESDADGRAAPLLHARCGPPPGPCPLLSIELTGQPAPGRRNAAITHHPAPAAGSPLDFRSPRAPSLRRSALAALMSALAPCPGATGLVGSVRVARVR